jgi:hypothetical protein
MPEDGKHTEKGNITVTFDAKIETDPSTKDTTLQSYLQGAIKQNQSVLLASIKEGLSSAVESYFKKQSEDKPNTLELKLSNPQDTTYTIGYQFTNTPAYKNGYGITYYFSGAVNKKEVPVATTKFLGDKNTVNSKEEVQFDPTKGEFQIFISNNIVNSLLSDLSSRQTFFINLRPNNMLNGTDFKLNVDFLGQVVPSIYNTIARDEKVYIEGNIVNLNLGDKMIGTADINFKAFNYNLKTLLSWTSKVKLDIDPVFDMDKLIFNYKLMSLDLLDSTVTSNQFGHINVHILNNWIRNQFKLYLRSENNSWRLFKNNSEILRYFFAELTTVEESNTGIIFGGKSIEFPLLKAEDVIKMMKLLI